MEHLIFKPIAPIISLHMPVSVDTSVSDREKSLYLANTANILVEECTEMRALRILVKSRLYTA